MLIFLILTTLLALSPLVLRSMRATNIVAGLFFATHVAAIALLVGFGRIDSVMLHIFRADTLAVLFHALMTLVLGFALLHSSSYLKAEDMVDYAIAAGILAVSCNCGYRPYIIAVIAMNAIGKVCI